MKPKVLNCHKFTVSKQVHLLLCTASVSIFWLLAGSEASTAQVNPSEGNNEIQLGLGGLLPVPQSPLPGEKSALQTVPPPPGVIQPDAISPSTAGVAVAPANPLPKVVQQTPTDDVNQQENAFIQQQMTGKTPLKPAVSLQQNQRQPKLPLVAAGGDNSDIGLGLLDARNTGTTNNSQLVQATPLQTTQEFTAPTTPTFNQVLTQPQVVAPLPPLPQPPASSVTPTTPTFNQFLNSPTATQSSLPGTTPPFNQVLNNQVLNSPSQPPPSFPTTAPVSQVSPQLPPNQLPPNQAPPLINNPALREPSLIFQGVYLTLDGDSAARARLSGVYPLSPQALFGATLDLTTGERILVDSRKQGLNINELYFATSLGGLPNLRFVVGQLDLTSYFDRNSFAKDGASQFFSPVFQTNPALSATGISSRTGLLVNWSVNDNIEAKAAVFSSADKISDFALDGFAGEVGIRYGNAIIRGTYATDRDAGIRDTFNEAFSIARGNNKFGPQKDDREEAYGINAEVFIPNLKLGLFGRYGRYENRDLGEGADTYAFGASLVDLFTPDDRFGLAYGRGLSNDSLRRGDKPDVMEAYYDFQLLPSLRLGFSVQGRDNFEETVFGIRVKTEFDVTPTRRVQR